MGIGVKRWRIVLLCAVVLLGGLAAAAFLVFRVTEIEYIGDDHYSNEELYEKLFDSRQPNALVYFLFNQANHREIPFIQKYEVEIRWPSKMVVTVYEKPVIGYVNYMGSNMYFDKDGMVVESSTRVLSGVPRIDGLKFSEIILNSKLDVGNQEIFASVLDLTQSFDKYQITADKINFDTDGSVTITMGEVKVMLGDCDNLSDKLYELKQMLPQLEGRKGTLHMEDYDGDSRSVIFKRQE
jgi:cell division protein FtsQ